MNPTDDTSSVNRLLMDIPEVPGTRESGITSADQEKFMETKLRIAESRCVAGTSQDNDTETCGVFPSFEEVFSGELPCPLFYVDKHSVKLKQFQTFDQLSEFVLSSEKDPFRGRHFDPKLLSKLYAHPLNHIAHFVTLGEYLRNLYEKDELMDVKIEVEGQVFQAHRIALCCFSGYFADLLLGQDRHRSIPIDVKLLGISAKAFATFLEFVYTGECVIQPDTASDMLVISEFLDVKELKARLDVIADSLPLAQAVKIVVKCKRGSSNQLYEILLSQIIGQFSAAALVPNFLDMDVDTFCLLLASDNLMVSRETEVFQVALRWIVHGGHQRLQHVVRVFSLIRFCHMTQRELCECVEETQLFMQHRELRDLVLIANWILTVLGLGRSDPFQFPVWSKRLGYSDKKITMTSPTRSDDYHEEFQIFKKQTEQKIHAVSTNYNAASKRCAKPILLQTEVVHAPAQGKLKKFDIYVIGGFQQKGRTIDSTGKSRDSWMKFCNLPSPRCQHAAVLVTGHIYLIGGYNPKVARHPLKSVHRMNLHTNSWMKMADMQEARMNHCACALKEKIYVFGGLGENSNILFTAECYDTALDSWTYIAMMLSPRFAASAASLGNLCYVTGGMSSENEFTPDRELDVVECYEPEANRWITKSKMRIPRCYATLVNVNQTLYLCGGAIYSTSRNGLLSNASIDKYNENTDTWSHVTDMTIPRHGAGVAVTGRRIYIVGGISSPAEQVLRSVECFDTADVKWVPGSEDLPFPARWISCISAPH